MRTENEKQVYIEPVVEIIEFEKEDVITTSNETDILSINQW